MSENHQIWANVLYEWPLISWLELVSNDKKREKYWLVLVKYYFKLPALVRSCIKRIQTNHNNQ